MLSAILPGTGNVLLIKIADSIKQAVRLSDLTVRIGEHRFAILLKGVAGFQEARRKFDKS